MKFLLAVLLFAFSFSFGAHAEVVIVQSGQMFLTQEAASKADQIQKDPSSGKALQAKSIKIKKGETVTFKNADNVTHNVYSDGFDLKAQPTGTDRSQVFDRAGHYTVKCAIHPKMKFDVEVSD